MSKPFILLLAAAALAAPGCGRADRGAADRQFAGRVLKGAIAYPGSQLLSLATGEDVAELQLLAPDDQEKVAAWFRQALVLNHWQLERDARNPDGSVVIFAQRDKRPIWITVQRTTPGAGTPYAMIGAIVEGDSIR